MIVKPMLVNVGNRSYWNAPRQQIVEYVLQEHQVLLAHEVVAKLGEFGLPMHRVSVARHLAALVAEGRVARLRHGLYAHNSSVFV